MAHELYQIDNQYSMAYVDKTPWHGLGQKLNPDSPLEIWMQEAKLNWDIKEGTGYFNPTGNDDLEEIASIPGKKILMRSDNQKFLSIVGENYKTVQPIEIIEFFRDLIESGGFKMHTAGSIFNGLTIWALAEIGKEATIMGQDKIGGYLLLTTSCDGSSATTGQFTSIRVVCNNTLQMSISEGEQSRQYVKIPHSRKFHANEMKEELGLASNSFDIFVEKANKLAKRKVAISDAIQFFINLYTTEEEKKEGTFDKKISATVKKLINLYEQETLKSSNGTAWGMVNAVTAYYDHYSNTKTVDRRLHNAWFGNGLNYKNLAFESALKLAA